jgi:hypothetical protein
MKHSTEAPTGRDVARRRVLSPVWALLLAALAACDPPPKPAPPPALADPAVFAHWPRVTERPIQVTPALWLLCRTIMAGEVRDRGVDPGPAGPHAEYSIVVRVSPDGVDAYREGRPLPRGAVVVKEKYATASATGPMQAYALMTKREDGFDAEGGDWEYAFVGLSNGREAIARGRLAGCAGCHGKAREQDFLFRSYGAAGR